jgi:hypothetical protein
MTDRRDVDRTSRDDRIREPVVGAHRRCFCSVLWCYGPTERPGAARRLAPRMKVSG